MSFTDKGAKDALKAQEHADGLATAIREKKVEDEFNEIHNIKTPEDAERFIQKCKDDILAKTTKMQYNKPGKEGVPAVLPKKRCLNCGSTNIFRQRDEDITDKVVWTDEYECQACKTRFNL